MEGSLIPPSAAPRQRQGSRCKALQEGQERSGEAPLAPPPALPSHMATPNCKGGWEIPSSAPRTGQGVWEQAAFGIALQNEFPLGIVALLTSAEPLGSSIYSLRLIALLLPINLHISLIR